MQQTVILTSHCNRITELLGLEGRSPSANPMPRQSHLEQVTEEHIQVALECLQRRKLHALPPSMERNSPSC